MHDAKATAALHAIKKYADVRGVSLEGLFIAEACPWVMKAHEQKERYYAHAFHVPDGICLHPAIETLPSNVIAGIVLHEVGHVASGVREDGSAEPSADQWIRDNLGLEVRYSPVNTLQFLDEADMEKLGIT